MQQQMPAQEQCGPQLPQQVMLCPVQYVYETPMIMPQMSQTQGDQQIQQNHINQVLINVKNPPPWIQNRPQNQVVYVQQIPNNYQPFMQPQMIQNHMYQPQMTYQLQPMLQENRQFIQIPNLNQFNTVQNPTAQIQQVNEDDKMPVLTQMLSQRANNIRATNVNNVRPTNVTNVTTAANMVSTSNMVPAPNAIRPITQNQQVQTDITTNTRGRPRNAPPQIITINPMQQRHFLANQKQEIQMNVRPQNLPIRTDVPQAIRADVPQHIRTKIPSSISVKTINRPILPRQMIRPFDVMPTPQNVYYSPIIMSAPNTDTGNRNIVTNAGTQYLQPNNIVQEMVPRATMPMQLPIPTSNVLPFIKTEIKSPVEVGNNKQIDNTSIQNLQTPDSNSTINSNLVKTNENNVKKTTTESSTGMNTESQTQTEEKLVRNTVFVQARGRILNEKEVVQNNTLKRPIDEKLKEETKLKQETSNAVVKTENLDHSSNKYIKIEPTEKKSSEIKMVSANSPPAKVPVSIQTQQSRITNLQMGTNNIKPVVFNMPIIDEISDTTLPNLSSTIKSDKTKPKDNKVFDEQVAPKATTNKADNEQDIKKAPKNVDKENIKEVPQDKIKVEDFKKKEEKIQVLTHVLEGYIIQESNVAFPIQKPTMDREIKKEKNISFEKNVKDTRSATKRASTQSDETKVEENADSKVKKESKGHFPWKYLDTSIESEKEMEFAVIDKNDPFAHVKKSTVETWTAEQLSSHLEKHKWTETAAKLLDEEIDGESILLVNKDQLIAIGVSEEHAERIATFAATNS